MFMNIVISNWQMWSFDLT